MAAPDPVAAIRWPNVPACHGWLSLDRRGRWRLKGEPVNHSGLVAHINRHYGPDEAGNWIFSNGPQAVYVALDYTPLVFRLEIDGTATAHTGVNAPVTGAYLDDEGSVLLDTVAGIGLLDDRDLADFFSACCDDRGAPVTDETLLAVSNGIGDLFWRRLPLCRIRRRYVTERFGFQPEPKP